MKRTLLITLLSATVAISFFAIREYKLHRASLAQARQNSACEQLFGPSENPQSWQHNPCFFIAHAGGGVDDKIYTNSREAVEHSIQDGYKLIELDFLETSDGHLVAVHEWPEFKLMAGFPKAQQNDTPLSLNEVLSARLYNRYTPLSSQDVFEIFSANPSLILLTDKIANFELVSRLLPLGERLIVEVFKEENVAKARAAGLVNPAYNLTELSEFEFVKTQKIKFVTTPAHFLEKNAKSFEKLIDSGVHVFSYTSGDVGFFKRHLGHSSTAFYTDFWSLKEGKCNSLLCQTY